MPMPEMGKPAAVMKKSSPPGTASDCPTAASVFRTIGRRPAGACMPNSRHDRRLWNGGFRPGARRFEDCGCVRSRALFRGVRYSETSAACGAETRFRPQRGYSAAAGRFSGCTGPEAGGSPCGTPGVASRRGAFLRVAAVRRFRRVRCFPNDSASDTEHRAGGGIVRTLFLRLQSRNPSRTSCSRIPAQSATGRLIPSTKRIGHPSPLSSI